MPDPQKPPSQPPAITREQLEQLEKVQLIDLLLTALDAQRLATNNMRRMNDLLEEQGKKVTALEDANKTQEAELIVLRNRPT